MTERFTIRPVLGAEESLTGYLLRVCSKNFVDIPTIWRICQNDSIYKVDMNFSFNFDIYPEDIVKVDKLTRMCKLPLEKMQYHTFKSILQNYYGIGSSGKKLIGKEIEKKNRKYCSMCLKENGQFNILWQVKEITMCDKHFTSLTDSCTKCSSKQKYLHNNLIYYKCSDCNALLTNQIQSVISDATIQTQLRIYEDWRSLFRIPRNLLSRKKGLILNHRKLALILLYLTHPSPKISSRNHNNNNISPSQMRKFVKLVKGDIDETISLRNCLSIIRKVNITFKQLSEVKVPLSYVRKILKSNKKEIGDCLTPWCKYQGTKEKLKLISEHAKGKSILGKNLYSRISVCTECWMKFGFCKKEKKWECLHGDVDIINGLITLFNKGYPKAVISRKSGLSYYTLEYYLGYLTYNNLLSKNAMEKFIDYLNSHENELIQSFKLLRNFERNRETLAQKAKELFGWKNEEVFTAYWHSKVQEYIIFQSNERNVRLENKELLEAKTKEVLDNLKSVDAEVSMEEVASYVQINPRTLNYHNINKAIQEHNDEKRKALSNIEENEIKKSIKVFVGLKGKSQEQIFVKQIYKHIGKTPKYIRNHYPMIYKYISKVAKESKEKQRVFKSQKLKEVIIYLYTNNLEVNFENIALYMNVSVWYISSYRGVFKGIGELIRTTIDELESE
ncbi:TniQ family protein [Cytobacillus dafuensis]|uniref:TniQ family protein n=1 Tax=Cytobacillus dafuensis TaxID=1742359 RepID=UPI00070CCCA5|nr:TniQ family protein [Cytobacillus dafuensis]